MIIISKHVDHLGIICMNCLKYAISSCFANAMTSYIRKIVVFNSIYSVGKFWNVPNGIF